jgi:putative membrane protein
MMWWYGNGMGGWGYGLMTVGNLLLWALIIFGVVTLLRHRGRIGSAQPRPTAEELLAERFARGEIAEEEYRQRLDVLRRSLAGTEK